MVTSVGHFISWVAEIVVFGGIEYVVTTALHGDALGRQTYMTYDLRIGGCLNSLCGMGNRCREWTNLQMSYVYGPPGVAHWMFVQLVPSINYTVFPTVQAGSNKCIPEKDYKEHVFEVEVILVLEDTRSKNIINGDSHE